MKKYFLISASGKDRPGIVAGLARALFDVGGNLEDSTMTRLGDQFTVMLIVSLPGTIGLPKLQKTFAPVEKKLGLHINTQGLTPKQAHAHRREEPRFLISVYGTDKPGIVYQVTKALADRKIGITDLNTKVAQREGSSLYLLLLEIQAPDPSNLDDLRGALDEIRQSLNVEITLQDIEAVAL